MADAWVNPLRDVFTHAYGRKMRADRCDRRRVSETAATHADRHHDPETGFEWEDGPDANAVFDAAVSYLRGQRDRYLAHVHSLRSRQ